MHCSSVIAIHALMLVSVQLTTNFTPMKTSWRLATAFSILTIISAGAYAGDACSDNFTVEGNFVTGKTFKTSVAFPAVRPQEAYARAYAFTAENGFTITNGDKDLGVITAAQSASFSKGKTAPLNIVIRSEPSGGARVSMVYALSGGLISPEDAVRKHFCLTMAAIGDGNGAGIPTDTGGRQATGAADPGNRSPQPPAPRQMRGYAAATPEQEAAIARELTKNVPALMRAAEAETDATLKDFIERLSCMVDYTGASAMNIFAAPGAVGVVGTLSAVRPMTRTPYHNKASCLTVTRVQGWTAPARNALRFEVVYTADDSGEAVKSRHEWVRQPDGTWLTTELSIN